jgi:hypothetical protein
MTERQSAATVLMVRPVEFGPNPQTRASNSFQSDALVPEAQRSAIAEFDGLVVALRGAGIEVVAVDDTPEPHTPDAIFPNNWFTTHADGTVVLYPMCAPNRRAERRIDLLERLRNSGFVCSRLVDLSAHELDGRYLEGTGSLVLDRVHRTAFACLSPRTDSLVLDLWSQELGFRGFAFSAVDAGGRAIYHTNVMLALGSRWAVVCAESISDAHRRQQLIETLEQGDRRVIEIDLSQMAGFAGNILELQSSDRGTVIAMSTRAHAALRREQLVELGRHGRIVAVPVPTIEAVGGGSVRCMLAELFLPIQRAAVARRSA